MRPHIGGLLVAVAFISGCTTVAGSAERTAPSSGVTESGLGSDDGITTSAQDSRGDAEFATVPTGASYIARPSGSTLDVYASPDPGGLGASTVEQTLQETLENGTPLALRVVGEPGEEWAEVQLPQRPNFTTGWVKLDEVEVTWTTLRIVVDLQTQTLTLFDGVEPIVWGTVAIGRAHTPTPIGNTYVSELLASSEPESLYGPFAIGLAMFSDEVTEYAGGNGQIGIHGTNRPDLLGTRASHGCVRTHNDLISELAGRVPIGTPVVIR